MIEISLKNIKKTYANETLFKNINLDIKSNARIGLIGQNGTGKSTLLKIITQHIEPDTGSVTLRKSIVFGYLSQLPEYSEETLVDEILYSAFKDVVRLREQMKLIESQMNSQGMKSLQPVEIDDLTTQYGEYQEQYDQLNGYSIDSQIDAVCDGLKISSTMRQSPFNRLSGGEKSRVLLSQILLKECGVLLLDEPTNHLDTDSIEWLETYINQFKGIIIMVSHDRYFLDNTAQEIIELDLKTAQIFKGNYSDYQTQKDQLLLLQFEQFKNQEKKVKAMEDAIKRFRDWGARADNESMFRKAANMEKRIARMEKVDRPELEKKKIKLKFQNNGKKGREVIRIMELSKQISSKQLFRKMSCHLLNRECVALLGKNGSGKTTLFKIIMEDSEYDEGELYISPGTKTAYLPQEIVFDSPQKTVLDEIRYTLEVDQGKARKILAKFLFFRDDVFKKIQHLSGGEKVRLKLCQLMHQDFNFLILDEPTNHLDIDSREMLEYALEEFHGTILFVSHDRYFINKLAERVLVIEDGKLSNYLGNYDYYAEKRDERIKIEAESKSIIKQQKKSPNKRKSIKQNNTLSPKQIEHRQRKIEQQITVLESQIEKIDQQIADDPSDYQKLEDLFSKKSGLQLQIDTLFEDLEKLENM